MESELTEPARSPAPGDAQDRDPLLAPPARRPTTAPSPGPAAGPPTTAMPAAASTATPRPVVESTPDPRPSPTEAPAPGDRTDGLRPVGPQPQVEARRVRRVLRRVDPWSVLKVAFIFCICMYAVIVLSSLLVWRVADGAGIIDDVEGFIVDLGFDDFHFAPEQMFRALLFGGAGMIVIATFMAVLTTVLFNLISDLVGGIRLSMVEQQILDPDGR